VAPKNPVVFKGYGGELFTSPRAGSAKYVLLSPIFSKAVTQTGSGSEQVINCDSLIFLGVQLRVGT
jgi:hypothetical protein